jgi:FKBP-type peptidyl-prolyl cis-trans isomerase 2
VKFTIETDDKEEMLLMLKAHDLRACLADFNDYLRGQDKHTENDVREVREQFIERLKGYEIDLYG